MNKVLLYGYPHARMMKSRVSARVLEPCNYGFLSDRNSRKSTGLPGKIAIWTSTQYQRHIPHIRVSNIRGKFWDARYETGGAFAISIEIAPKVIRGRPRNFSREELAAVRKWIVINRKLLLERWISDTMDSFDICERIRPLRRSWYQRNWRQIEHSITINSRPR